MSDYSIFETKSKNFNYRVTTLVRLIMTGNIVAGKNIGGYKYGGIAEKPPNLTRHYFTCNIIFTKNCKSTEFYLPYCITMNR